MSRLCVNSGLLVLLAGVLAACSSTGGSGAGADQPATAQRIEAQNDADRQVAEAAEVTGEAIEVAPAIDLSIEANLDEISERMQRQYDAALTAMRAQDFVQAELAFEEVIREEPGFPGPWVNLAIIYKRQGRSVEARTALEQAIAIAPEFAPAHNELGMLLREAGEFDAAEAAYLRALDEDPVNAIAHLNLGILLDLYLYRSADALQHYSQYQATRAQPDETVARWIVDLERRVRAAERVAQD